MRNILKLLTPAVALLLMHYPGKTQQLQQDKNIGAITEIKVKPGFEKQVLSACVKIQARASSEPGCLVFVLSTKKNDPATVVLFEIFRDDAALEAHKKEPHTQEFLTGIRDKFIENKVTFLTDLTMKKK